MSLFMKTSPLQRGPDLLTENLPKSVNVCPKSPIFTSNYSMNDSPAEIGNSDPKPRGEEARRRRRERRNKEFRGLKLYPVLLRLGDKKKRFWRVTKPRVGGGRTMKTYANQDEAETAFDEVQSVPVADFLYAINIILSPRSASASMEPLRLTG